MGNATLLDGREVVILDRSEFESEAEYQAALEKYMSRPKRQRKPNGEVDGFPMITRDDMPV